MIKKIYKTKNILKVGPQETLHAIMPYFTSSHDAAFVFEDPKNTVGFLGVVSPYHCIIKKSYPANTKAKHCLTHPAKVDMSMPIDKVSKMMMESKIHYLPVFADNKFEGIISARRLLSAIVESEKLSDTTIAQILATKKKPLISVFEQDPLSKALPLLKKHSISKLIVLSDGFKLAGVLSYYDIISFLSVPKERQGYAGKGNKQPLLHSKVRNFAKKNVLTLTPERSLKDACNLILKKQIGSIIVVDGASHPIGIITTRDILSCYIQKPSPFRIDLVARGISEKSLGVVNAFIQDLNARFTHDESLEKAKVVVKEKSHGGVFEAIVSLFGKNNKMTVIKQEGKNLGKVLTSLRQKSTKITKSGK